MPIVVTGGKGFLGTVLTQKLQKEGFDVQAIGSTDCDLSNPESIRYLSSLNPDFIFHLAGKTGVGSSWHNPNAFYRANTDTTRHVLEVCRTLQIPLHYVSGYIYGDQGAVPISETALPHPGTPYAHSKWMGEEMCRSYARLYSVSVTISRPFNIYGPHQSNQFFIPQMIEQMQTKDRVCPFDLKSKRDYVFVEDVADALVAIMKRGKKGSVYNIGTGTCNCCKQVIEILQKVMGLCKPIISKNQIREGEILHAQADITKIQSEIGWHPKYSLIEGLTRCV